MSISLTPAAADHVRKYLASNDGATKLRLRVKPTGCSGYMYVVEPETSTSDDDTVFESQGLNVVVDPMSLAMVDGTEVDIGRQGLNTELKFNNPNVAATCGCGESFTIKE